MSDDAEVINIVDRLGELPPVRRTYRGGVRPCGHRKTALDVDQRRIYCADCDVELDPIEVLDMVSRSGTRFVRMRQAIAEGEERLKEVLAEEGRAKERLRRARAKLKQVRDELRELDAAR